MDQAVKRPARAGDGGPGGRQRAPEPPFLAIGVVTGAHGLRGELRVRILTDDPLRFRRLQRVYIGLENETPQPVALKGFRLHKGRALLWLEGCGDRTTAETLQGRLVQVPVEEALPLGEGEYFEHQILDLEVWTVEGQYLGDVAEILYTGANEVYVVRSPEGGRDVLLPAIQSVVLEVDLEAGRLTVELPPGLP